MKRLIAIAAISMTALTGAASAMTAPGGAYHNELKTYASGADLSGLSQQTLDRMVRTIHGGGSESEKRQWIRAILVQAGK